MNILSVFRQFVSKSARIKQTPSNFSTVWIKNKRLFKNLEQKQNFY